MRDKLACSDAFQVVAEGNSMRPLIRPGDKFTAHPHTSERLRPGDLVLMQHGDQLMLHRFHRLEQRGSTLFLITKGDAGGFDAPKASHLFLARVVPQTNSLSSRLRWLLINEWQIFWQVSRRAWLRPVRRVAKLILQR